MEALRWAAPVVGTHADVPARPAANDQSATPRDSVLLGAGHSLPASEPSTRQTAPAHTPTDPTKSVATPERPATAAPAQTVLTVLEPQEPEQTELPPRSRAMIQAWREASDRYCEELGDWARRVVKPNADPKDFGRASQVLARVAEEAPFPMARDVARGVLVEYAEWKDPVDDWSIKKGAVDGPVAYLRHIARQTSSDRTYFSKENRIPDFVEALAQVCSEGPVPPQALQVVAHSAFDWQSRADRDLKAEIRKKEPVEFDRHVAERCARVVETWWRNGQIEVRVDGKDVPASFDVQQAVRAERVAVRDGVIDLQTDAPALPADIVALAHEIADDSWKKKEEAESKGLRKLRELAERDMPRAEAVVGAMVSDAERHGSPYGLHHLLGDASADPTLRNVFGAHLPRISTLVSGAQARGRLAVNNLDGEAQAGLFDAILATFPEAVDARLVERELGPVLRVSEPNTAHRAAQVATNLMEKRPDLAPAVADAITFVDDVEDHRCWNVLETAADKHGWVPSPEQVDWITRQAWIPVGRSEFSVFGGTVGADKFRGLLRLLGVLQKKCPETLDGVRIPDSQFHMQPLGRALLDRLLTDPHNDVIRCLEAESSWGYDTAPLVYDIAFRDKRLAGELISTVEDEIRAGRHIPAYLEADSMTALSAYGQKALTVLMSAPLDEEQKRRFEAALQPEVYRPQGHFAFDTLTEPLRARTREAAVARLSDGSTAEILATASEVLLLDRCSSHGVSGAEDLFGKSQVPIKEALARLPVEPLTQERARRFQTLEQRLQKQGLDHLSNAEVADLQVLAICGSLDPAFDSRLREAIRPHCRSKVFAPLVDKILESLRADLREQNQGRLRTANVPRAERLTIVGAQIALAKLDYKNEDEARAAALSALIDGLRQTDGLGDMPAFLESHEAVYRLYTELAPAADDAELRHDWENFKEVVARMGGARYLDDDAHITAALDLHRYVEERTAAGEPRDRALKHAMGCHLMGWDPRITAPFDAEPKRKDPGRVIDSEQTVSLGGIVVRKKAADTD